MISCTEFIPCYSELFSYLDEKNGIKEVERLWDYLFKPTGDGIPLINFVKKEGIRGCWSYWSGTLNEEAADFSMYLNEKRGYFTIQMKKCPSKGRLLDLEKEIGIKPYPHYCLHCAYYRSAVESVGLKYQYNFIGTDKASCSLLIYDPKIFDGRIIVDDDTLIMNKSASENDYFHPDFHSSMNMGIDFIGENYGYDGVIEFLTRYTQNIYKNKIKEIKENGIDAIERHIIDIYNKERCPNCVTIKKCNNSLDVNITYCPAVKHLSITGRKVSEWYKYTTECIMSVFAEQAGYTFTMHSYDYATGAAHYSFT